MGEEVQEEFDWTREFQRSSSDAFSVFNVPEESLVSLLMSDSSFDDSGNWEAASNASEDPKAKVSLRSKVMGMRAVLKMLKAIKGKKPPSGAAGAAAGGSAGAAGSAGEGGSVGAAGGSPGAEGQVQYYVDPPAPATGEKEKLADEDYVWNVELPPSLGLRGFSSLSGLSFLGRDISDQDRNMMRSRSDGGDMVRTSSSESGMGTLDGDIDEVLMRLENAPVLSRCSSSVDSTSDFAAFHAIPDMAKIFRAPSYVMNHMAIGISPSRWARLAPDNAGADTAPTRRWSLLRSVVNTGIAFRMGAKKAVAATAEEQVRKKEQLQLEVDRFKTKLLHITDEWEDFRVREETSLDDTPLPTPTDAAYAEFQQNRIPSFAATPQPERQASTSCALAQPAQPEEMSAPYSMRPRGPFMVKSVASGSCYLFPELNLEGKVLDIDVLVQKCQAQFPVFKGFQILEVLLGRGEGGAQPRKRARQQNLRCSFKLMPETSSEAVTVKVWSDGKTLSHGCKHRKQLLAVNIFMKQVIQHSEMVQGLPVLCGRLREYGMEVFAGLDKPDMDEAEGSRHVEVLSAPLLGSWDLNLKVQRLKLHLQNLAQHLREPSFENRISEVRFVPPTGNAVRFHNMSIYVRRECLSQWPAHNAEMNSIYVNVYESGKCTVLAAPSEEVANELADIVSSILHTALEQPNIRVEI